MAYPVCDTVSTFGSPHVERDFPVRIVMSSLFQFFRGNGSVHLRVLYGLAYAVYGVLIPFLPLVFHAQGLTDTEISFCLSSVGLAALIPPLLFAHLADRHLPFERIVPVVFAGAALLMPFWLMSSSVTATLLITLCIFGMYIPALSLLDAYTLDFVTRHLPAAAKPVSFPSIRVWGSIGFMAPALLLALAQLVVPVTSPLLIVLATIFGALTSVAALSLPQSAPLLRTSSLPSREALAHVLRRPYRDFFIATTTAGLGISMFYIIFPRYLQELGLSTVQIGLLINLGVLCEIILMPFSHRLHVRFGAERIISFAMWAFAFRMIAITAWPNLWLITLTQALHAPLIIGIFVSAPLYLRNSAGESFRFSLQSLYTTLMLGFSRLIGPALLGLILGSSLRTSFASLQLALFGAGLLGLSGYLWAIFRFQRSAD